MEQPVSTAVKEMAMPPVRWTLQNKRVFSLLDSSEP